MQTNSTRSTSPRPVARPVAKPNVQSPATKAAPAPEKVGATAGTSFVQAAPQNARAAGAPSLLAVKQARKAAQAGGVDALPGGQKDTTYDGAMVGAEGKAYPAGTPLSQVPAVQPKSGPGQGTIVAINGIGETLDRQAGQLQKIADATGSSVIGLHNATEGAVRDILQTAGDKVDLGKNAAVDALAKLVHEKAISGEPLHLMAHSQGAAITSRALTDARNRLMLEEGMSQSQAEKSLSHIQVETFGGAASNYPDGPQYQHYINNADLVPTFLGLGSSLSRAGDRWSAGEGAEVHRFTDFSFSQGKNHDLATYLEHRKAEA